MSCINQLEQVNQRQHFGPSGLCLVVNKTHVTNFLVANLVAINDWTNPLAIWGFAWFISPYTASFLGP
ncbi:hypothetical protein SMQE30_25990 [Serratia marcescens]|nr:hypothetical protein SMQE30_25990 [Serratia marcescens]